MCEIITYPLGYRKKVAQGIESLLNSARLVTNAIGSSLCYYLLLIYQSYIDMGSFLIHEMPILPGFHEA